MNVTKDADFQFGYEFVGRGRLRVTLNLDGRTLDVDEVNLGKSKDRDGYINRLCSKFPAFDRNDLEVALYKILQQCDLEKEESQQTDVSTEQELDLSMIARPEQFIRPEITGLAFPSFSDSSGQPVGTWRLYLRWSDGRREKRTYKPSLDLGDGRRLWLRPELVPPTIDLASAWSRKGREGWSNGEPTKTPAELFQELSAQFAKYLDFPPDKAVGSLSTLALWTMLTYVYQGWGAVPFLYVGGPTGSGKSRVFEVLSRLAFRPLVSSNLTAAALFRNLDAKGGTLLLDEAEKLRATKDSGTEEVMSMLLAGYKRGGRAIRLEPIGDSYRSVAFDVYGPKAIACINGLPPALLNRCIPLLMFRSPPSSTKPRIRIDEEPLEWQRLRDELYKFALEYGGECLDLAARAEFCPSSISGRDYELWQPLFAIATMVERHGFEAIRQSLEEFAAYTIELRRDESLPDTDRILLEVLANAAVGSRCVIAAEILEDARTKEPDLFRLWTAGRVASRLKTYGIPTPKKIGGRRDYRHVTLKMLRDIQANYDVDLSLPE
jgi:hypothetical protein